MLEKISHHFLLQTVVAAPKIAAIVYWHTENKRDKLGCVDPVNLRPKPDSGEAVAENRICEADYGKNTRPCIVLLIDRGLFRTLSF